MKTREEIENFDFTGSYDEKVFDEGGRQRLEAILEVLLDIRDLLANPSFPRS